MGESGILVALTMIVAAVIFSCGRWTIAEHVATMFDDEIYLARFTHFVTARCAIILSLVI